MNQLMVNLTELDGCAKLYIITPWLFKNAQRCRIGKTCAISSRWSVTAACRRRRGCHATVARRIASLETALSASLFDRRVDGYVLTARGRQIAETARAMEDAAIAVADQAEAAGGLTGLVRLTMGRSLADAFVIDRLGELRRQHPLIDLEIVTDSRVMSLSRREADIALRFGQPKDSDLLARRLATVAFDFYASRQVTKKIAKDVQPAMIGFDAESLFIADAAWLEREFSDSRFAVRSNSQTSQAAAARAGLGVAQLPLYVAASDPNLVSVRLGKKPPDRELWLLLRRDIARVPRVRVVADYLVALFRRERRILTGRAN
jgi:DNA-binding transcriptional LysR family regulator